MKLLYICQHFAFPHQPNGTRAYDLSTSFLKKGIDVTIITTNNSIPELKGNKGWGYIEIDGLKIHALNCPYAQTMNFKQRIVSFFKFLIQASRKSLSIKADLVLATSTPLTVGIPALVKKFFCGTPFIFEVRDVWPEVPIKMGILRNKSFNWLLKKLEKCIYKKSSAIVPLSVGMKKNILSRISLTDKKIVIIPNISEVNRFAKVLDNPEQLFPFDTAGKKIVLYCGTMGMVNGIDYLVDLAEETQALDSSIVYCIFGEGKELRNILKKAKEKKILEKTFFYGGKVAKDKLPSLYSLATVGSSFVIDIPVLWDNSANKFFDTLAAGKPILINHGGWQADIIKENKCGYVLSPQITSKEAKEFVQFMQNKDLIKYCGEQAYKLAIERYTLPIAVGKYINLFNYVQRWN
ncbi:glycosyltransferase family 4 protein [Porphyromonas macacae]|uniref:glycosyltransferase family 4 protein n=1 Tax=Porphyromonas macacae TaxID=28115 RepID=UPI0024AD5BB5|nr:glycosyltransferase family 4 protein [Porphyromonas macacae]